MFPITCPHCGNTLPIENIMQDRESGKARGRCKKCKIWIPILLPSIRKKLVYLDQSFLSAACLETDRTSSQNEVRILAKLTELKVRQKISVVISDVHSRETSALPDKYVGDRKKLWQFQNELADGNIADDSGEVFDAQWRRILTAHDNSKSFPASDIGLDDPHRVQIGVRVQLANVWRQKFDRENVRPRDTDNEKFRSIIERQLENMPSCKDARGSLSYIRELWRKDIRQGIINKQNWRNQMEWIIKEHEAGRNVDYTQLKTADAPFSGIIRDVIQGLDEKSTLQQWLELLDSDSADLCAYVRIRSAFEAALLRKWRTGCPPTNSGTFDKGFGLSCQNDIDHISTFVPYVDALTTDDKMRNLCATDIVADELKRFSCKIFSKSNYDKFEAWLNALLAESVTHNVQV